MCGAHNDSRTSETKFVKLSFKNAMQIKASLKAEAKSKHVIEVEDEPMSPVKKIAETVVVSDYEARHMLLMSDDPLLNVQVFCNVCHEVFKLSAMKNHVRSHSLTYPQYVKKCGNPRMQLVHQINHRCGICREIILLNTGDITAHVRGHNIGLSAYMAKYMHKGQGLLPSIPKTKALKPQTKTPLTPSSTPSLVSIQCKVCFKTFKHNKQLSAHMKRH